MTETTITISDQLRASLQALKPVVMLRAVAKGMERGTLVIAGKIQKERLTGKGPFPIPQNRLGVVTGRLRQSVRTTKPQINGDQVTTSIGSNVSYAALHEFGFSGLVKVKAHPVTIEKAFGRKLKAPVTFTRKAHERSVTIAERKPFRTGIAEHLGDIETEITREVLKTMNSKP